jgi:hypothetical protein
VDFPLDDGDDDMTTSSLRSYQRRSLYCAALGVCDFFIFRCSLRSESSQEPSANKHRRGSFGFAQDRLFDSAL